MDKVHVKASTEYDVLIDGGLLSSVGELCRGISSGRCMIVTDGNVAPLWLELVEESFISAGVRTFSFVFEAGEKSKNKNTLFSLLERLAELHFSKDDYLLALGGGVTGDLTGLAAALYMRGISYVQAPTTLLAMVDSSVGGKTAIDLEAGKNLIGAFYQPRLVVCDTNALKTLPKTVFYDGMAEVIKYGVLLDRELFDCVKGGTEEDIQAVVARCVSLKAGIVAQDEKDNGTRKLLNFGHTIGHAIEKRSGYEISHGSAVAVGMVIAAKAAEKLGWSTENSSDEIIKACAANGLPTTHAFTSEDIFSAVLSDKKITGEEIDFIYPQRIGSCRVKRIGLDILKEICEIK